MFGRKENPKDAAFKAVREDDVETLKTYIAQVGLDVVDSYGANLVRHSVVNRSMRVLSYVLEQGCKPNIKTHSGKGSITRATSDKNYEAVKELIKYGADIEAYDCNGMNSLHYAAKGGRIDIVKALIEAKADISAITKSGKVAKDYAKSYGHKHISKYLYECEIKQLEKSRAKAERTDEILLIEHNKEELKIIEANDNVSIKHCWKVTDDQEIIRIADKTVINSRITEIFNFQNAQIITILSDLNNKDRSFIKEAFNESSSVIIEEAMLKYEKETGKKAIIVDLDASKQATKWTNRN